MNKKVLLFLPFLSFVLFAFDDNYSYMIYDHGKYMNKNIDDITVGFQGKNKDKSYAFELTFKERKSSDNNLGFYSIKTELKNNLYHSKVNARLNYIFTDYNYNDIKYHYVSYYLSKYNYNTSNFIETGIYFTYSNEEGKNFNTYNIISNVIFINNLNNKIFYTNIINLYFGNKLDYNCVENSCNVIKRNSVYYKGLEYTGILNFQNNIIFNINLFINGKLDYLDKYIFNNNFNTVPLYNKLKNAYNFSIYKKLNNNLLFFVKNTNNKYFKSSTHKYGIGLIYKY